MASNLFQKQGEVTTDEVAHTFLDFFISKDHDKISGSSILAKGDPTLLFINSGMAPLKDYFLGHDKPKNPRLTNIQGCIRTIDIDEVGDRHHLSYFEMMGSWSIGDYWKQRAIELAFELLTGPFGFPVERLFATVYGGEPDRGLPPDENSRAIWIDLGLPEDHIVMLGADNFWGPAGKFGPCGPCTEVYFDTGAEYGPAYVPGGHFDDKNRYIEIWNAGVFMQYDKQADGFSPLGIKSVDTGSGLERMVMTLNSMTSVYEVDVMAHILKAVRGLLPAGSHFAPGQAELITDHVRASSYILSEGVKPSNLGAGYIPRRLIRRSLAALGRHLDPQQLDLLPVVEQVLAQVKPWSPFSLESRDAVFRLFREEQDAFKKIYDKGMKRLDDMDPHALSGTDAFQLFATHGLPVDVVRDWVRGHGAAFDEDEFEAAREAHQDISRQGLLHSSAEDFLLDKPVTVFGGHEATAGQGAIVLLVHDGQTVDTGTKDQELELVCDRTVFYGEGGGQVGDQGIITGPHGQAQVLDTTKTALGHIVHHIRVTSGHLAKGDLVEQAVDGTRRQRTAIHHSSTHLLNAALRATLGDHVRQHGSLVEPGRLRFDFSHPKALSPEELRTIEAHVNDLIRHNHPRQTTQMPYEEAVASGAQAMFSEKYDDVVSVVALGQDAVELCGGTHVGATGEIGLFLITSEGSSSRGVRRITAVAGPNAYDEVRRQRDLLAELGRTLSTKPENVLDALHARLDKAQTAPPQTDTPELHIADLRTQVKTLPSGIKFVVAKVDAPVPLMRDRAQQLSQEIEGIVCLLTQHGDDVKLAVAVHKPLSQKVPATQILQAVADPVQARGGGKPFLVAGGGTRAAGIPEVLARFESLVSPLFEAQVP